MRQLFVRTVFTSLLAIGGLNAHADFNDFFAGWAGLFSGGVDPNSGLTLFPVLQIPMGGRFEGMGTAHAAVAGHTSFADTNPAASAALEMVHLSFFHRSWTADAAMDSVAVVIPSGRISYGLGVKFLHEPFTQYDDSGEPVSAGLISETVLIGNLAVQLIDLPVFAMALGANVKPSYRHIPASIVPDQSTVAVPMDIGLIVKLPLFDLTHSGRQSLSAGLMMQNIAQTVQKLDAPLPTVFSAGLAYSPTEPFLIAVDLNVPVSFDPDRYPPERMSFAVGGSAKVARVLSIHTGLHYKGANPRLALGAEINLRRITIVSNYNLDLMGRINPLDKFSAEVTIPMTGRGGGS